MLSTNSTSGIQKRRQHHRRQQSLDVPTLATPLPANIRRTHSGRPGHHRRGLSLDQSLKAAAHFEPTKGFRPLHSHDIQGLQLSGPQCARTQTDTNPLQHMETQQFIKQETQEQSLHQPGFPHSSLHHPHPLHHPQPQPHLQAPDFQSHLQQQLNGMYSTEQAIAMQNLQSHIDWYEKTHGGVPTTHAMQASLVPTSFASGSEMPVQVYVPQPGAGPMPASSTPVSLHHTHTVPNTPQHRAWPSPPQTHAKHTRSHSLQYESALLPHALPLNTMIPVNPSFSGGSFEYSDDRNAEASAYSSSAASRSSPSYQQAHAMPTVFEQDGPILMGTTPADALLLASAGVQDFNDPRFIMGDFNQEQTTLDQMGIDATYIETGTTEADLDRYLESPHGDVKYYVCKWEGCAHPQINRKENARSHVQNHLDDRKWKCNPCGKRFTRLHDLKRHALTHTNERPAICPCGKSFARQDALTRHRQRDMCKGVLPGFEKCEEEKPKRGRPRKDRSSAVNHKHKRSNRPDMASRTTKAAVTRALDRERAAETGNGDNSAIASDCFDAGASTSSASDHSMPDTPPQDSDVMDAVDFFDIDSAVSGIIAADHAWLNTPPTSPPSAATTLKASKTCGPVENIPPSKLSQYSSPLSSDDFMSSSYYNGSSPFDMSDAVAASVYSASSPPNNDGINSYTSPLATIDETEVAHFDQPAISDNQPCHSSPAAATSADLASSLNKGDLSGFLSSSAFAANSDFSGASTEIFGAMSNILDSYPGNGNDIFSPADESHSGSSVYNSDTEMVIQDGHLHRHAMPCRTPAVNENIFHDHSDAFGDACEDPGVPKDVLEEQIRAFLASL